MCRVVCVYVPEALSGVVGEGGERGLVDIKHPHLLAVAGELEPLGVRDGLVDDDAGVPGDIAGRACSGRRSPCSWRAPSSSRACCRPPRRAASYRTARRRAGPGLRRSPAAGAARGLAAWPRLLGDGPRLPLSRAPWATGSCSDPMRRRWPWEQPRAGRAWPPPPLVDDDSSWLGLGWSVIACCNGQLAVGHINRGWFVSPLIMHRVFLFYLHTKKRPPLRSPLSIHPEKCTQKFFFPTSTPKNVPRWGALSPSIQKSVPRNTTSLK